MLSATYTRARMAATTARHRAGRAHRRHRGRRSCASSATATRRPPASTRWSAITSGSTAAAAPTGKRMRPLLGLLAYASITGDHEPALPGAAAVELGHNFSLVHDDIEDGDVERRHRPTLWALHGIPQAINTGDMLFSLQPGRAPPPDRPRLPRHQGPPPDAPVRRDLRAPCARASTSTSGRPSTTRRCRSSCTST